MDVTVLVMAKAPVPGTVKTRLAATVGHAAAAELAAAALLDTIDACAAAVGPGRCRLALAGDLAASPYGEQLRRSLAGWTIVGQRGEGFGDRLAHAHQEVDGPVVQVGMDTPQVTPDLLLDLGAALDDRDAVLAPADDGGWWALGLMDGAHGALLRTVPMSTPHTYAATLAALRGAGLRTTSAPALVDADHLAEAHQVAARAPYTRFARTLARISASRVEVAS